MSNEKQNSLSRKPYHAPTFTVLGGSTEDSTAKAGRVIEMTFGSDKGFSDDGGHAGYKKEGGTCHPDAEVYLPPRS